MARLLMRGGCGAAIARSWSATPLCGSGDPAAATHPTSSARLAASSAHARATRLRECRRVHETPFFRDQRVPPPDVRFTTTRAWRGVEGAGASRVRESHASLSDQGVPTRLDRDRRARDGTHLLRRGSIVQRVSGVEAGDVGVRITLVSRSKGRPDPVGPYPRPRRRRSQPILEPPG